MGITDVRRVEVADIALDCGTQARAAINDETVAQYAERMEEGDVFPPVVVFHNGSMMFLADGFHRTLAARRVGFLEIDAEVRTGARDDALWYALGANRTNGHRMTRGDVRHAVEVALQAWPERTQREIAEQVGCSQRHVSTVQSELRSTSKLTIPAKRTGADGKERPTSYKKRTPDPAPDPEEPEEDEDDCDGVAISGGGRAGVGLVFADGAIFQMKQIEPGDPERDEAFDRVARWLENNR